MMAITGFSVRNFNSNYRRSSFPYYVPEPIEVVDDDDDDVVLVVSDVMTQTENVCDIRATNSYTSIINPSVIVVADSDEDVRSRTKNSKDNLYKCFHCGGECSDLNVLRIHIRQTHLPQLLRFQCPYCCYKDIQLRSLRKHIYTNHPNRNLLWCPCCYFKTYVPSVLKRHMQIRHNIRHVLDNVEQDVITIPESGDEHDSDVEIIEPRQNRGTEIIDLTNPNNENCDPESIDTTEENKTESCEFIDITVQEKETESCEFVDITVQEKETENIHKKSGVSCFHCGASFHTRYALKSHIKLCKIKDLDLKLKRRKRSNGVLNCLLCDYRTRYFSNLRRHIRLRHGVFNYQSGNANHLKNYFRTKHSNNEELCNFLVEQYSNEPQSYNSVGIQVESVKDSANNNDNVEIDKAVESSISKECVFLHNCKHCEFKCSSAFGLELHTLSKHSINDDLTMACSNQNENFPNNYEGETIVEHHKCLLCKFTCLSSSDLSTHISEKHSYDQNGECSYQNEMLENSVTNDESKENGKPHKCLLCEFRSSRTVVLKFHMATTHDTSLSKDKNKKKLKEITLNTNEHHINNNTNHNNSNTQNVKEFNCSLCDYVSPSFLKLSKHMVNTHSEEENLKIASPYLKSIKSFSCGHCTYKGTTNSDVQKHVKEIHDVHKLKKCPKCNFINASAIVIKKHMLQKHKSVISLKSKKYIGHQRNGVKSLIDTAKSSYGYLNCKQCNFKSLFVAGLKRHTSIKHKLDLRHKTKTSNDKDAKPFKCSLCNFSSSDLFRLKTHLHLRHSDSENHFKILLQQHKKEILTCKLCNHSTSSLSNLRKHMMTNHTA